MKDCIIEDCQAQCKSAELMCKSHWFQVPKPIRDEVWSTWKKYANLNQGLKPDEIIRRSKAYRAARTAAIEAVV